MSSTMRFDTWQDSNGVLVASGAGGKFSAPGTVLQVVSTTKTDSFSTASSSYVDITGLSATITPKSTTSKILVIGTFGLVGHAGAYTPRIQCVRNSTAIGNSSTGIGAGLLAFTTITSDIIANSEVFTFLDSPSSTSATTYKFQIRRSSSTVYVGVRGAVTDDTAPSTITLLEIAG